MKQYSIPQPPRFGLEELVLMCGEGNRPKLVKILTDHAKLFKKSPGSRNNHHSWPGGYWDHVTECMNLAVAHFALYNAMRPRAYKLWEALEVLFVHDLEKPWKYHPDAPCPVPVPTLDDKPARAEFRLAMLVHYDIQLNERQQNALKYAEGEIDGYSPDYRAMWPLAHLVHTCDEASARQFSEYPYSGDADAWKGAGRITDNSRSNPEEIDCPTCGSSPAKHEWQFPDPMFYENYRRCTVCRTVID